MDNRQLTFFLAIVEEESITRAAERLFVAQPYLSQQLKLLEEEVGTKLIDRTTRKLQITEAGKMLAYRAKQILDLSDLAVRELKELEGVERGTLQIGCISSAVEVNVFPKLQLLHEKYGEMNFEIRQNSSVEIRELLKRGIIELGIMRSPVNLDLFHSFLLPVEPMAAIGDKKKYFSDEKEEVSLAKLADKPLLTLRRYRDDILDQFRLQNFEPRILCAIEDARPLLSFAESGMGVAIIPKDWSRFLTSKGGCCLDITDLELESRMVVAWRKNHELSAPARYFLESFSF